LCVRDGCSERYDEMAAWLVKDVIPTRPIDQMIAAASGTINRSIVSTLLLLDCMITKVPCVVRSLKLEKKLQRLYILTNRLSLHRIGFSRAQIRPLSLTVRTEVSYSSYDFSQAVDILRYEFDSHRRHYSFALFAPTIDILAL
jgi:hypothetical protein